MNPVMSRLPKTNLIVQQSEWMASGRVNPAFFIPQSGMKDYHKKP
jgi:hypothetical protein